MTTPMGLGLIPLGGDDEPGLDAKQTTAVRKALELLGAFRGVGPSVGLTELAKRASMPKSTAFRLLRDLESAGFVERDGQSYRLGLSLFELGSRVTFNRPNGLRELAMHDLSQLYTSTGLTAHLAVLSGTEIVFIEKLHGRQPQRALTVPGARTPASCTALGKAILAYSDPHDVRSVIESGLARRTAHSITEPGRFIAELKRVHETGIAKEREENALGLAGAAAPILSNGYAIAAVGVSGPTTGVNWAFAEAQVKAAGASIGRLYLMSTEGLP